MAEPGTVHVVGAGLAGLSAALAAVRMGHKVVLYEATARAGGRARALSDEPGAPDNGTHVLIGANREALSFLAAIGARQQWIEPEPRGLPVLDLETGAMRRVGLSPWSWWRAGRRPPGLGVRQLAALARLTLAPPSASVAAVLGKGPLLRDFIEPLTVAALNTPVAEGAAARLAPVLRRALLPGGGRVLLARDGLGVDIVAPTLRALQEQGVAQRFGQRLESIGVAGGGAVSLRFGAGEVDLDKGERVVLALPPHALEYVLPGLVPSLSFEPIVNIHLPWDHAGPPRFCGLIGGRAQWVLFRPGLASLTISAAREEVDQPAAAIIEVAAGEAERAAGALGLGTTRQPAGRARVVKEKRATVRQAVGDEARPPLRPFTNLTLAGDWLSPLPATLEAAIGSGRRAVRDLTGPARRTSTSPAVATSVGIAEAAGSRGAGGA